MRWVERFPRPFARNYFSRIISETNKNKCEIVQKGLPLYYNRKPPKHDQRWYLETKIALISTKML